MLVEAEGTPPALWVLDFEVAHWGDPAFDPAFMLNHLFIKSVYNSERAEEYIDAARLFWNTYDGLVDWDVESETVLELAILMLARVDGKSPVEYVQRDATKETLRRIAKRAIQRDVNTVSTFAAITREMIDDE